jgi:uroporphyrinogen-III synthase
MKILVTRPSEDAARTASRLMHLGHEVLVAPVTVVLPTHNLIPNHIFDAVIATSANALRMLDAEALAYLSDQRLFCVGAKTASAAKERGFLRIITGRGSGADLVSEIIATLPANARCLYLTGKPRKPAIEDGLAKAGIAVTPIELYAMAPVKHWPACPAKEIQTCEVALHFSRASVEALLIRAVQQGLDLHLASLRHLCLSEDVAAPLRARGFNKISVAPSPQEDELLALL